MAKILKLDKKIAELIAAGEVVERPASAVKELVENSIDAGATAITVEIRNGGIDYIRVSDNGTGITKEDVKTAFIRNATSKIKTKEDLYKIGTLGFRGEALPSITAISKLTMITKTIDEDTATKIEIEGGTVKNLLETGSPTGTIVTIKEMFYNTPARMKFLKSNIAEGNAISVTMDRMALSHPNISFKLVRDNKMTLFTPGNNDLLSTIHAVYGKEISDGLLEAKSDHEGVKVSGFISKTTHSRGNRGLQLFFVNKRFVKTQTARVALEEAYKNSIMKGRFPFCVLFIDLPWESVDVNTHPAKIEVRFTNEKPVYHAVYYATKTGLNKEQRAKKSTLSESEYLYKGQKLVQKNEGLKAEAKEQLKIGNIKNISFKNSINADYENENSSNISFSQTVTPYLREKREEKYIRPNKLGMEKDVEKRKLFENKLLLDKTNKSNYEEKNNIMNHDFLKDNNDFVKQNITNMDIKFVGEVFKTYILAQTNESLYLIDKHAAHERIIFEELKKNKNNNTQILLKPVVVNLSKEYYSVILERKDAISELGIILDDFGNGTVLVREFPAAMENANIITIIEEISDSLLKGKKDITPKFMDNIYDSIACKAAIKANDGNTSEELIGLINLLLQNDEIKHCPHGRPVIIELEKKEIEKKFGRT